MAKTPSVTPARTLGRDYQEAIEASGLVDDVMDISGLAARPYRYTEGDHISRRGDAAESLWIIVTGSIAVKEDDRTLFVRHRNEVVGEQTLLGNGYRRMYDLAANESNVEVLVIDKSAIEDHAERETLWRNIAKIISLKLKNASHKVASLSRQLEDDTRILHAYTNEYALGRRMQSGGGHLTDYKVDRAIVWFSDVVDFSRHTLTLSPERAADIVQRFFNAQSIPIAAHGGHIDKFIGDGLMAFWVLDESSSAGKECVAALRAAEEALKAVMDIRIGRTQLRLRIGLHLGLVLSGDFGSTTRHQFTLIGPEVNRAARLEDMRPEDIVNGSKDMGDIRMSPEFHEELGDTIQQRYPRHTIANAKNIGKIGLFS